MERLVKNTIPKDGCLILMKSVPVRMNALQDFYLQSLRVQGCDAGWECLYKLRFSEANIFSFDIAFVSALFLLMYQLQSCLGFEWSAPIAFFPQQPTHFQWAIL